MRLHKLYCLVVSVILSANLVYSDLPPCTQIEVVFGDEPQMNAFLGNAVATTQLDSNRVLFIAGAPHYGNSSEGAAFVYARDNFGDSPMAKSYPAVSLQNPNATVDGQFGAAVAVTKNTILVGHPMKNSVYVYSTQDYGLTQVLEYNGLFGTEIAVYGDSLLAVGAPDDNLVYIFEYSANSWKLQSMITDDDAPSGANFGISIALDDLVLAVGASGNNTAYVYERNGTEWNEVAHLRPTGEISANVLVFGSSIAVIPGVHTVIVGNYLEPSAPTADKKDAGTLYFFERSQVGNVVSYSQVQRMVEVNSSRFDHFGESLFVIDQHTVLAGAHKRAEQFTDEGVVYVLTNTNGTWVQSDRIKPTDPSTYSWFGWSVAVYKNSWEYILVVGSRYDTTKIYDGGAIRLFSCPFGSPPRETKNDSSDNSQAVNIAVGVVVAAVGLSAVVVAGYFIWKRTNKGYTKSDI